MPPTTTQDRAVAQGNRGSIAKLTIGERLGLSRPARPLCSVPLGRNLL
jgi:hypothetical protein